MSNLSSLYSSYYKAEMKMSVAGLWGRMCRTAEIVSVNAGFKHHLVFSCYVLLGEF